MQRHRKTFYLLTYLLTYYYYYYYYECKSVSMEFAIIANYLLVSMRSTRVLVVNRLKICILSYVLV